ncbi:MAG: hypothetical protein E6J41_24085 [Chloroflexi bacterium]|nr:MAG: hypothetical protein E6J41_24085 [Chloroflexota bacterium]
MTPSASDIDRAIAEVSRDPADPDGGAVIREAGLAALPVLSGRLTADAPIDRVRWRGSSRRSASCSSTSPMR